LCDSGTDPYLELLALVEEMHRMTNQAFWQFHCPECGFGDGEHGLLLTAEEIYCMVCSEEERRLVRLHRWEVVEVRVPAD
jgi:hypothetical protein